MSTQQVNPSATGAAAASVLAEPDSERERIFEAFRRWGYLEADLDPLGFLQPEARPELQIEGETAEQARRDLLRNRWRGVRPHRRSRAAALDPEAAGRAAATEVDQSVVLDQLIRADLFEQVLQHRYLGSKRFSLEGVTALIPLVDEMLEAAGERGAG